VTDVESRVSYVESRMRYIESRVSRVNSDEALLENYEVGQVGLR
jgi:hypothetical protein